MDGFSSIRIAQVQMPEKGMFFFRTDIPDPGTPEAAAGEKWILDRDYGEDVGVVKTVEDYDPARHTDRVPGFRLIRPLDPVTDERRLAENDRLAASMCATFVRSASPAAPDLNVPYTRLSFGRGRLFLRFTSSRPRADVSAAVKALRTIFGVDTQAWQMGPRDEVAALGALGPCGRACCCATWQTRYPQHLTPERRELLPTLMNGTCGRFKCCLAFERGNLI